MSNDTREGRDSVENARDVAVEGALRNLLAQTEKESVSPELHALIKRFEAKLAQQREAERGENETQPSNSAQTSLNYMPE